MRYLLIALVSFPLFFGCSKVETISLSEEIKQNFFYKPGSYWIYKDSITGRLDSLYVTNSHMSHVENPDSRKDQIEILIIDLSQ